MDCTRLHGAYHQGLERRVPVNAGSETAVDLNHWMAENGRYVTKSVGMAMELSGSTNRTSGS
jgi:hypothetical protein